MILELIDLTAGYGDINVNHNLNIGLEEGIVSLGIAGLLILLMKKTELGVLNRAVSGNPRYAQMIVVDLVGTYLLSFILVSAIVGIPSILIALHNQLNPDIGLQIYLFAVISVVIGGMGSLSGILLGDLSVGILQKVSVWKLPEEWSNFITFSVFLESSF